MDFQERLDAVLKDAEQQISADLDNVPLSSHEYWGVKMVFLNEVSDERVGVMIPRLYPAKEQAQYVAQDLTHNSEWIPLIAKYIESGMMPFPNYIGAVTWLPVWSGAVKMAVVPF